MNSDKILFLDTETGGIDPLNNSLLSIGLAIWQDFRIIDEKEILINDGILNVTTDALDINKINIQEHVNKALKPKEAINELYNFILKYFKNGEKIILGGHNINFDINFLKQFLGSNELDFYKTFSHRSIDTSTILYFLYLSGILKLKIISSQEAFEYFNIHVQNRHSALGDVIATAELFSLLLQLLSTNETNLLKGNQTFDNFLKDPHN